MNMLKHDTKMKIREFLSKHIAKHDVADDDALFEKGYISSLMAMELVLFVEKEFGIQIGNDDLRLENFASIKAISELVVQKTGIEAVLRN